MKREREREVWFSALTASSGAERRMTKGQRYPEEIITMGQRGERW